MYGGRKARRATGIPAFDKKMLRADLGVRRPPAANSQIYVTTASALDVCR